MSESYTWGISGTSFLLLYGALCLATAVGVLLLRRSLLNAGDGTTQHALGVYELALLNGGPRLAVAAAAAKLHRENALSIGASGKTIAPLARPHEGSDLEHEVYDAVERTSGLSPRALRRQLEGSAAIRQMTTKLTDAGLLLGDGRRALVNVLWLLALPVPAIGIARVVAGLQNDRPILYLAIGVGAACWATLTLARRRTRATARGRELLDSERGGRTSPAHTAVGAEIPLAVALFGVGALWAADPAIASAWSIPRERAWGGDGGSGGSGGGCGGGGGGCGGGGCGG